ncbi:CPBP family intramembrane glutamic endopeptidase [Sporosarcina pasteurii]|uniref:CAAX amino terminal protease self- immunity n=1 Tax=Sporosarcina pasteurii TaxID=1474 RepID=A0A380CFK9_SPOPA|nr:CPBP family intramembrane glutamic endopeptidase [Sporosarcina pasteurii]MDS9473174.1 CPBP family intramembrane glutamic endopeptidase [Sporosarcina pasteurii]QBQ06910.1 CPBP family intramembrane metalloprotease [Sporosarcina pasteurii]SUJ19669.1 CAAX amino terminal protease self- immunity [Sporosarcina pasteurii]
MKNWKIYLYLILTYIIMQLASVVLASPLTQYFNGDAALSAQEAKYHAFAWSLFTTNLLAAIVFYLLFFRKKNFFKIFDGKPASIGMTIVWGIISFFLALFGQMLAGIIEMTLFGIEPGSDNTALLSDIAKVSPIIIISMVIFAPLLEELIFRRVLFGGLYQKTNFIIAAIISALVFAVVHNELEHTLIYMAPALVFSFVYYKTKRLLAPIIGHFMMNGFVVIIQLNQDKIMELQKLQQSVIISFFQ